MFQKIFAALVTVAIVTAIGCEMSIHVSSTVSGSKTAEDGAHEVGIDFTPVKIEQDDTPDNVDPFEVEGKNFLISSRCVFEVTTDGCTTVVTLTDAQEHQSCLRVSPSKYLEVTHKDCGRFGGLLGYKNGKWVFYPYYGKAWGHVNSMTPEDQGFLFYLEGVQEIKTVKFCPKKGTFEDI